MEKNIAVIRKTIIVLTLLVGILIGALIGNPMKRNASADFPELRYEFERGYCFGTYKDSITYLGKANSRDDCRFGNAQMR